MIVNRASLTGVVLRLALFYWCVFTMVFLGEDITRLPDLLTSYADVLLEKIWYLAFTALFVTVLMALQVLYQRERMRDFLLGRPALGFSSSIGRVPTPGNAAARVPPGQRLPLLDPHIQRWLLEQGAAASDLIPDPAGRTAQKFWRERAANDGCDVTSAVEMARGELQKISDGLDGAKRLPTLSSHAALFLAIWDTLCAHAHYPASHRQGGHGRAKLYVHSMSVAARCLTELSVDGGNWSFDGVYSKRRGRTAVRVFENTTNYQLHRLDPLVPIVGLAHDLGKIEAYSVSKSGEIKVNKEPHGNTLSDEERGVIHDRLGPRIMSRLPEYWTLRPQDRSILSMAVGHYHHPSQFPLDSHEMLSEPRSAALMMLLVKADRDVSMDESGAVAGQTTEMTEDDLAEIYETFVKIITEPGRINGVGNPEEDAVRRIGQKHEDFLVIKTSALMSLIRQELNLSLAAGEHKHDLTNHLLSLLKDKGLLYDQHNGADFGLYTPLYRVALFHGQSQKHITDLVPALLMRIPGVEFPEFYHLTHLAFNPHFAVVRGIVLSHVPKQRVKDPDHLKDLVLKAFGDSEIQQDLHAEVAEDTIEAPVPSLVPEKVAGSEAGAHVPTVTPVVVDKAVAASVQGLVGDESALKAAARLLARKGAKKKQDRAPSLGDLADGDGAAQEAADGFAEAWVDPTKSASTKRNGRKTTHNAAALPEIPSEPVGTGSMQQGSEEPPWLFAEDSVVPDPASHDESIVDPSFDMSHDFVSGDREGADDGDEPDGFELADRILAGNIVEGDPPGLDDDLPTDLPQSVDLSDDIDVPLSSPPEATRSSDPAEPRTDQGGERGEGIHEAAVAVDTAPIDLSDDLDAPTTVPSGVSTGQGEAGSSAKRGRAKRPNNVQFTGSTF